MSVITEERLVAFAEIQEGLEPEYVFELITEIRRQRALIEGLMPLARLGATALEASNEG